MKPLDILSAIPQWKGKPHGAILDSPAFAMQGRIGEEPVVLRAADVEPAESDALALSIAFGDEPHALLVARSPRFKELDKIWDSRADMPEPILLALVEKDCGPLFQMLENAVRKQLRLVGLGEASGKDDETKKASFAIVGQGDDPSGSVTISLTRSASVVSALGNLRNLDLTHETIRSQQLSAVVEYAAFAMPDADVASLEVGDSVLVPELGSVAPRLVVDGRFAVDGGGVSPYAEGALVRVCSAEPIAMTLGEVFDASMEGAAPAEAIGRVSPETAPLSLVKNGKTVATGRLDRIGDQRAFVVEK